jgi:23S rRNA pseudouridine2605 synthase
MEKRLSKILSEMGLASRRKADDMISEGRIIVNGTLAELGQKADPEKDHIKLDGKLLNRRAEPKVYLMMNKPVNVMTSMSDPQDRPTVKDYLGRMKVRVYPVGRLDFDSEGLLLFTNDGDFTHSILHPSKKLPKTYQCKVKGMLEDRDFEKLRNGIRLEDGKTAPASARKLRKSEANSWVELTITEGKKRQVRRMLQAVGHPVSKLVRVKIGGLHLGKLKPGEIRHLTDEELSKMKIQSGSFQEADK